MVVEEMLIVSLSGGAPWGFRLQGGVEHNRPLKVAKVRKRSKACRAGLREGDELVSINESSCTSLSHAQAMNLIDGAPGSLRIRVKRAPTGFQSVVLVARAPSPRIDKEYRASLRAKSPSGSRVQQPSVRQVHHGLLTSPTARSGLTSPLGSEAYYGETDSDADVVAHERHRRQKRRSPSNCPAKSSRLSPDVGETSEMSGYDSAPDAQSCPQEGSGALPGVGRREVVYKPTPSAAWSMYTSTETSSVSADEQSAQELLNDEDGGLPELHSVPPLVSPERAKEALMLGSRGHLVPMVGPVNNPVDEELTKTYMDKARQAKLHRGDTQQDKQVKEARTKCRTIASLLTDAPNPHSKGVLMFKKRRQRSKKYTLTSYGSVDEDMQPDSQDEESHFFGSESEVDEEGFSAAPDPTWDSDVLEMLDKRSASRVQERDAGNSLTSSLSNTTGRGARLFEQQRKRAEEHAKKVADVQAQQNPIPYPARSDGQPQPTESSVQELAKPSVQPPPVPPKPTKPPAFTSMSLSPGSSDITSPAHEDVIVTLPVPATNQPVSPASSVLPPPPPPTLPELPSSSVFNRTARPFAPGFISHRAATAPVSFHPTAPKKTPRPVSVAVVPSPPSSGTVEKAKAVPSVTFAAGPPSSDVLAESPSTPAHQSLKTIPLSDFVQSSTSSLYLVDEDFQSVASAAQSTVSTDSSAPTTVITPSYVGLTGHATMTSAAPAAFPVSEMLTAPASAKAPTVSVASIPPPLPNPNQETVPVSGGPFGFLQEACRRGTHKPMFKIQESKKNSPNPELLSLVQNFDETSKHGLFEDHAIYKETDGKGRIPPPVAPKPRVIPETSQIPQAEGKGAELFARRQNRKDLFVVDSNPFSMQHQYKPPQSVSHVHDSSTLPSNWKYSPNVRAPPPVGYNPLQAPSCPLGIQHERPKGSQGNSKAGKKAHNMQKEGIKAIEAMRRQPYQLNPAMFSFSGGSSTQSTGSTYQNQRRPLEGHTLTQPRQVPVKTSHVYEIKRFSTPTPMSAPTVTTTLIAPRSRTTLAEPLSRSDMTSPTPEPMPPPAQSLPVPSAMSARPPGLPNLPNISSTPAFHPTPYSPPAPISSMSRFHGLQGAKQFKSAPELSALSPHFLKPQVQAPRPRFIATRVGVQPQVWRPGAP